ncbi:MAG: hypothetical protein ACJZ17_06395 [Acidimicrobiales bacterium]|jgi:hypothetical protein|tara:strand:+ start:446 stop:736 length:291 start_codon:yes stop_codon:yes gene_type:complete
MKTDKKNENWNVSITNKFIKLVSQFRSLTTDPIISSSKWIIYGIAIFLCVLAAIIFFGIAIFKIIDQTLPGGSWLAFIFLGLFFCVSGILILKKRK